jgi:hypothetical protein
MYLCACTFQSLIFDEVNLSVSRSGRSICNIHRYILQEAIPYSVEHDYVNKKTTNHSYRAWEEHTDGDDHESDDDTTEKVQGKWGKQ